MEEYEEENGTEEYSKKDVMAYMADINDAYK